MCIYTRFFCLKGIKTKLLYRNKCSKTILSYHVRKVLDWNWVNQTKKVQNCGRQIKQKLPLWFWRINKEKCWLKQNFTKEKKKTRQNKSCLFPQQVRWSNISITVFDPRKVNASLVQFNRFMFLLNGKI